MSIEVSGCISLRFPLTVEVALKHHMLYGGNYISRMEGEAGWGWGGDKPLFLKKLYSRCQKFLGLGWFHIHGLLEKNLMKLLTLKMEYINKWYGIEHL